MAKRCTLEQLEKRIKAMESFLDPRIDGWDNWPDPSKPNYWLLRWIMEYCMLLKERYYKMLKRGKFSIKRII